MQDSKTNTVSLPAVGSPPATLFVAGATPIRIAVRNIGGVQAIIAHDSNTLADGVSLAGTFRVPPGDGEVFVLAPRQGIYAVGTGAGGFISIAISEAIPNLKMES